MKTYSHTAPEKRAIDAAFSALSYACQRTTSHAYRLDAAHKAVVSEGRKHYAWGAEVGAVSRVASGYVTTEAKGFLVQWSLESDEKRRALVSELDNENANENAGVKESWDYLCTIRPEAFAAACIMHELRRILSFQDFAELVAKLKTGVVAIETAGARNRN